MAWSTSYDGSKILTFKEMNAAKSGYNIFPNNNTDQCPTKSQISATSVSANGYTYRVSISGSYTDNQLVPNSALSVSSVADTYAVYLNIHFYMQDYTTGTGDQIYNKWTNEGGGCYITQIPCYLDVLGTSGESKQFTFTLSGQIDGSYPNYRNLYDLSGSYSTIFVMPKSSIIEGFSVFSECDLKFGEGIYYSISSSAQGKDHDASMTVYMIR